MLTSWTHQFASVNGIRLHYVEAGSGPLVVLLHGFPEFWYSWRHQIPALAQAGFRVVAPDLRGYGESGKPAGVGSYHIDLLVADVLGLIRHLGQDSAHVAGHDWGGVIAWTLAMRHPDAVTRLAILNAPHPAILFRQIRRPWQLFKSWYIFFFQLPWLPEWLLRQNRFGWLLSALRRDPVHPSASAPGYRPLPPGHRAGPAPSPPPSTTIVPPFAMYEAAPPAGLRPITRPTLVIWGERDRYLDVRLLEGVSAWVPDLHSRAVGRRQSLGAKRHSRACQCSAGRVPGGILLSAFLPLPLTLSPQARGEGERGR